MTEEMTEDKVKTREMVTKMTQIYKSMERTYNEKIETHEKEVEDQELQKTTGEGEVEDFEERAAALIKELEGIQMRERKDGSWRWKWKIP